eukprot:2893261-Pyramimonas_sp.AAC.2
MSSRLWTLDCDQSGVGLTTYLLVFADYSYKCKALWCPLRFNGSGASLGSLESGSTDWASRRIQG